MTTLILPSFCGIEAAADGSERVRWTQPVNDKPASWPASVFIPLAPPFSGSLEEESFAKRVAVDAASLRRSLAAWTEAGRPMAWPLPAAAQATAKARPVLKLPRYVQALAKKDGTHRIFHYVPPRNRPAGWKRVSQPLPLYGARSGSLEDPRFLQRVMEDAEKLNAELDRLLASDALWGSAAAGTLPAAMRSYMESERWERTKRKKHAERYCRPILRWSADLGHPHMSTFTPADLRAFLRPIDGHAKVQVRSYLNILFKEAFMHRWIPSNTAEPLDWKVPPRQSVERLWTREDVWSYQRAAYRMGHIGVAVALEILWSTGQRINDVCAFRHGYEYLPGRLQIKQSKTGALVPLSLPQSLDELIADVKREDSPYLVHDARGRPFLADGAFNAAFTKVKKHMVLNGYVALNARALRHTTICRLHKEGETNEGIAALTGHDVTSVDETLKSYMIDYNNLARSAMEKLHPGATFREVDINDPLWTQPRRPDLMRVPSRETMGLEAYTALKLGISINDIGSVAGPGFDDADDQGGGFEQVL